MFTVEGRGIPIVHRILSSHLLAKGGYALLTKGDNNAVDDRGLSLNFLQFFNKETECSIMSISINFFLVLLIHSSYSLRLYTATASPADKQEQ